jgi:hypothetical protein
MITKIEWRKNPNGHYRAMVGNLEFRSLREARIYIKQSKRDKEGNNETL